MSKVFLKTPDFWHWPKDWVSAIKNRTGWTDDELAERVGTGARNLRYITNRPPTGRTLILLRLLSLYLEKTGRIPADKDPAA